MKKYRRILVKVSGEALGKTRDDTEDDTNHGTEQGIDHEALGQFSEEIAQLVAARVQVALVVGAGNFLRGTQLATKGTDRVTADYMGMLATVINALAIQDILEAKGVTARVMSAIRIQEVCEDYIC